MYLHLFICASLTMAFNTQRDGTSNKGHLSFQRMILFLELWRWKWVSRDVLHADKQLLIDFIAIISFLDKAAFDRMTHTQTRRSSRNDNVDETESVYLSIYLSLCSAARWWGNEEEKVMDDLCCLMTFGRLGSNRICIDSNINSVSAKDRWR